MYKAGSFLVMVVSLSTLRILLVDSDEGARRVVSSAIKQAGASVVLMAQSIEQAEQLFNEEVPDIVVASWDLPPSSGLELTRTLRKAKSPYPAVPIVLMMSETSTAQVAEARDVGVTDYLFRPFSTKNISVRLTHMINNQRPFIVCETYRGPDRRQMKAENYQGPLRREGDGWMVDV